MKNGQVALDRSKILESGTNWWQAKSQWQKLCLVATVLTGVVLVVAVVMVFVSLSVGPEFCSTTNCKLLQKEILTYIDRSYRPCDDFYLFACGNFIKNTHLDNKRGSRSVKDITEEGVKVQLRELLEQPVQPEAARSFNSAKKLYRACMNESAIEMEGLIKIKQIFFEMGGWPTLDGDSWDEEKFHWTKTVEKLREMGINFNIFFQLSVEKDKGIKGINSSYVLKINNIPYTPSELSPEARKMYLDFLTDIATIFGANTFTAKRDSNDVLDMFLEMAKIYKDRSKDNSTKLNDRMNLSELQRQHPTINWYGLLYKLIHPISLQLHEVIVEHPDNLRRIEYFIKRTPKRKQANFIVWHTLQFLLNFAPYNVLSKANEFIDNINGVSSKVPRWKTCIKSVEQRMGSILSAAYIQKFIEGDDRDKIIEIITDISEEFKKIIQRQTWLDYESKKIILSKLASSTVEIPYYERLLSILSDNKIYDQAGVYEGSYLQSALNIDYVNMNIEFGRIGTKFEEEWWKNWTFVSGTDVEYSPRKNALIFPVGIFSGIYFRPGRPDYMNYGVLGSAIAHEISHIFIRAEHAGRGDLRGWWSPASLLSYDDRLRCLRKQYGKFVVSELDKHLDPNRTLDEDFADVAGTKLAYDAYLALIQRRGADSLLPGLNYSTRQLFWIASAFRLCSRHSRESLARHVDTRVHSPEQFRVDGPLQDVEGFAKDFGCAAGDRMNPRDRCAVWS